MTPAKISLAQNIKGMDVSFSDLKIIKELGAGSKKKSNKTT